MSELQVKFEHAIGDVVYNKPVELNAPFYQDGSKYIQYVVVSRIYEEIGANGNGVVSYVVRHVDPHTPGGGKLYKFAQDELIHKDGFDSLVELKRKTHDANAAKIAQVFPLYAQTSNTGSALGNVGKYIQGGVFGNNFP